MEIVFRGKTKKDKEILIRYPKTGDVKEMLRYINELSREKTFIRNQGEQETLKSETKYLNSRLEEIKNGKVVNLLAFCNGRLVGSSDIKMKDKTEKHIGIFGITVDKNFRGEGLGDLLMELILKEAKKKLFSIKIVTLEVYSTNNIARNLYKKFGFKEFGMLPKGVSRRGKFEDEFLMYKNI